MDRRFFRTTVLIGWIASLALLAACSAKAPAKAAANAATAQPTGVIAAVKSDSSVIAEGKLIPTQEASLSFTTSGVVEKVLVAEGDSVKAGQPLVRLVGNDKLQAAVSAAELEVLTAQQALADLQAGAEVARSQAQLALAEAKIALDKAQKKMNSKDWQRGSQSQVDIARANYVIAENGVKEATKNYDRVDDRPQDDPIRAELFSQLAAAKQLRDRALANLNYLLDKPNELDVNEVNANASVAQANVNEAIRRLNLVKDGPDANLLALAQERVKNARLNLTAAQASLKDLELTSPFAGTVTVINIHAGEFVSPGAGVVHLADFSAWLVQTTDLTELDVVRVKLGQPAMVRFDALPEAGIIGRVTRISAQGENHQGDVVYTVTLKLDPSDAPLHWNMTSSVKFLEKEAQ